MQENDQRVEGPRSLLSKLALYPLRFLWFLCLLLVATQVLTTLFGDDTFTFPVSLPISERLILVNEEPITIFEEYTRAVDELTTGLPPGLTTAMWEYYDTSHPVHSICTNLESLETQWKDAVAAVGVDMTKPSRDMVDIGGARSLCQRVEIDLKVHLPEAVQNSIISSPSKLHHSDLGILEVIDGLSAKIDSASSTRNSTLKIAETLSEHFSQGFNSDIQKKFENVEKLAKEADRADQYINGLIQLSKSLLTEDRFKLLKQDLDPDELRDRRIAYDTTLEELEQILLGKRLAMTLERVGSLHDDAENVGAAWRKLTRATTRLQKQSAKQVSRLKANAKNE